MTCNRNRANIINTMPDKSQKKTSPSLETFFENNPIFTLKELDAFLSTHHSGNTNTRKAILTYYKNRGRIQPIRRALYASIPKKHYKSNYRIDPFLLASKLAPDSVLSHHSALEVLGKAYSMTNRITYYSEIKTETLHFQGTSYHRVRVPADLMEKKKQNFGTITMNRQDMNVTTTGFERTLVDILARPDLSGSWEEIWRSLESIEFFNLDMISEYVNLLNNRTTTAKVGFYLEQHKDELMVEESILQQLEHHIPKTPHYLERLNRKDCILIKRWNLLVPRTVLLRSWGEVI